MARAAFNMARTTGLGDPAGWRGAAILAGSIVLHALILISLALRMFEPRDALSFDVAPPPLYLEMEPRPLLRGETAREPVFARDAETTPARSERAPTRDARTEDAPSPPAPRVAAGAPPGSPPAPEDAWRVTPESLGGAVARSLRTGAGGCRIMDGRLSPGEQALCDERFNEAAARAAPLGPRALTPGEARREAQFARDGARALAQYEARRAPLAGGVGLVGTGDCPGSNFGMGCPGAHLAPAMRQGARTTVNPGMGSSDTDAMRPPPGQE